MQGDRVRTAGLVLVVGLLFGIFLSVPGSGSGAAQPSSANFTHPTPESLQIITVDRNSSAQLWPYTSRKKRFDSATLPINIVVLKHPLYVRYLLETTTDAQWERIDPPGVGDADSNASAVSSGVVLNGTRIKWQSARGSTRYSYIHQPERGEGRWVKETFQVHDGTYLGTRYHLRLYGGGSGTEQWTAIQAHREHWDWFRLRHTVDSVDRAQDYVERGFYETWFVESIDRNRFANGGALDADGWVTVIRLTKRSIRVPSIGGFGFLVVLGAVLRIRHAGMRSYTATIKTELSNLSFDSGYLPLVVLLALIPLAIRLAGTTFEGAFPGHSPKLIAGVLYPTLIISIPAVAWRFSVALDTYGAAITTAAAFGSGMLLDYSYLEIHALPLETVIHRVLLIVALASIAGGAASSAGEDPDRGDLLVALGVGLWGIGLVIPFLDLL